ncbi:MAG TPA: adenosylmethionine--8-amino-7-oxononanoate transaminase [Isosphaeraceae bacterium]|nr:adenosylmethionine--8-amino-7-oxononanoate transaminase [Isosphaeraceae bacterium]
MPSFFITGVGTGVGKTLVTTILCQQLRRLGRTVSALKPIVSGFSDEDPHSDPALILHSLRSLPTPEAMAAIAPWRFAAPLSPHLAARRQGRAIALEDVVAFCRAREREAGDLLLVEGAGGVMTPIDQTQTFLDLIIALGYPVILVTGTYLGALSHTLTALRALGETDTPIQAIIVSESEESIGLAETVESLEPFAGDDVPVIALPRLAGSHEEKRRQAPRLTRVTDRPVPPLPRSSRPSWYEAGWPHVWLPYCQMRVAPPPLPVIRTQGCRIVLADGRELIDGIASWWSVCHGYNHPHIQEAVGRQLATMPHVMFGGLAHEPAFVLAERLSAIAPRGLSRVFFTDSGSIAVEVALKIALQYWLNTGRPEKTRFLCFTNGYHGDTFGAMSVSDPERSMHRAFRHVLARHEVVEIPTDEPSLARLDALLAQKAPELAAMIIEPLVQGAGGMRFHSPEVLAALHAMARKHDVLFVADEIATGFWRTGHRFACDAAGVEPDILCLGKALTGGTITMGATLARDEIFAAFLSDDWDAALMHGPTFMANPLACAAANASLDLFEHEPRECQVRAIATGLRAGLEPCRALPGVVDVRVQGAIGVVQLAEDVDVHALRPRFVEQGVWVRPFQDVVYLMPPLVIEEEELCVLTRAVQEVLSNGC